MPEIITRLVPLPALAALLVAAVAAILFLYRPDRALVSPAAGRWLAGLRAVEAILLIALLADPARVTRERVVVRGEVLVIVDGSRSFSLSDPHRPPEQVEAEARALGVAPAEAREASRWGLARSALASGWLDELKSRFEIHLFSLSRELRFVAADLPPADGDVTDLARPISEEAARRARNQLSGIVLFTDGNHHAMGDPREAARGLALLGAPLVAVGVGSLAKPADLELESIDATGQVFAEDEIKAQVTIAAAGLPALDTAITITLEDSTVQTIPARVAAGEGLTRVQVAFPAGAQGRKKFSFAIAPVPGEVSPANNFGDLWIDVLSEKARVLFLDGAPRWEQRYLRASWSRDKNVDLGSFLVTPPPDRRLPSGFPRGREDLFAHEVIVLGDVEPSLFEKGEIESIRDFVTARGGALVLIAGEKSMPYRWASTPLADILPVDLIDPAPSPALGASPGREGFPLALTLAGQSSAITRLVPGRERNLEIWELLQRPRWLSPAAGLKPGAEALVTVGDCPVLATHAFGAGRVLYAGIDSTWKWRYRFGDELHRRFWGQVVRWAVSNRLDAQDGLVRLRTGALVYAAPAKVTVEAWIPPSSRKAADDDRVDAVITRLADGKAGRVRLEPVPKSGGRYLGEADLEGLGIPPQAPSTMSPNSLAEYRVHLDVPGIPGYASKEDRAVLLFVVEPIRDAEARDLTCNTKLLEEISAISGGRFLPLSRFREADDDIPDRRREEERVTEMSPWDHPVVLAVLLLGILAAEWILRKRLDLV